MVIYCAALGCKNRQNSLNNKGTKLSFHRFPKEKNLCEAWVAATKRSDFFPNKFSYLCSEHFTEDQFNLTQKGCRLRPHAVPTVFSATPKAKKRVSRQSSLKSPSEVPPQVKILPKQVPNSQIPIKIAPKPLENNTVSFIPTSAITDLPSLADTVISSNLIEAALKAYIQSSNLDMSQNQLQHNKTPVSVFMVHPQANGSNVVTIPTIRNAAPNSENVPTNFGQPLHPSYILNQERYKLVKNQERVTKYEERIENYKKTIKRLEKQHRKQQEKIDKLRGIIKDLKQSKDLEDDSDEEEDDVSEDLSESEIYAELLKQQSESEDDDGLDVDDLIAH